MKVSNHTNRFPVIHHVFFWLKDPASAADRDRLIAGIKNLAAIELIGELHVGLVADTEKRDAVDQSWDVSELMFFKDLASQAAYQAHPVHKKFVDECSHLWEKVVVYDMVEA